MPSAISRKPLWKAIQDVARLLGTHTPTTVLHECLQRGIITPKMLSTWGNSAGEQRVKAALKHEIAPGIPFSGVIDKSTQGEFTWAPVDSMTLDEYRAFLRNNQENAGADIVKIGQQVKWGRNKFGDQDDLDQFEEFSSSWMQRYIDLANGHDSDFTEDPDGEEEP